MPNFWKICEDYALCKMWESGMTANQIADRFYDMHKHRSRDAILGRVHRLKKAGKITGRNSPLPQWYIDENTKPVELGITLLELTNNTCRFPITAEPTHRFCGEKTGGATYCQGCRKKVYSRG